MKILIVGFTHGDAAEMATAISAKEEHHYTLVSARLLPLLAEKDFDMAIIDPFCQEHTAKLARTYVLTQESFRATLDALAAGTPASASGSGSPV